jgi:branched-chain amino acid transport system substrate-binding protein
MSARFASLSALVLAGLLGATAAHAQQPIRIGVIMPFSGQFADTGLQVDGGIKLYMKQMGDTVAGRKIEIIRRDVGGAAPDVAKRLAQELVVRDKVDILAGFVLTPNAMAAADISAEAKKLMVIMNAGTSIITTRSPYSTRTSITLPQAAETMAQWAHASGTRKSFTMVSDYGPGIDAEQMYQRRFKAAGGEIVGSVRFPVANPDFAIFAQRARDINPESIFLFMPAGTQPVAFAKAMSDVGINPRRTRILGTGDLTSESALAALGELSLGIVTAWHYDYQQKTPLNAAFVKAYNELQGRNPDFLSVGGYDGMHLIYEALKKTGGDTGGDALIGAVKGMRWESPRGPIYIDPETRDIVQTVYIRRVERVGAGYANVTIDKVEGVKDPVLAGMKK